MVCFFGFLLVFGLCCLVYVLYTLRFFASLMNCVYLSKKKKMLSDACGGFIVVDMDTDERCHLKWARL